MRVPEFHLIIFGGSPGEKKFDFLTTTSMYSIIIFYLLIMLRKLENRLCYVMHTTTRIH